MVKSALDAFSRMKISQKVLVPVFLILIAFCVVFFTLILFVQQRRDEVAKNIDSTRHIINYTDNLTDLEKKTEIDLLYYRYQKHPMYLEALDQVDAEKESIMEDMHVYLTTSAGQALFERYVQSRKDARSFRVDIVSAVDSGDETKIRAAYDKWTIKRGMIDSSLADLIGYSTSLLNENISYFNQVVRQLVFYYLISILAILALIAFSIRYFRNYVIKPLKKLTAGIENYSAEQPLVSDYPHNDEIGVLSRAFSDLSLKLNDSYGSLKKLAFNDSLTGLPNRQFLMEKFEMLLGMATRRNALMAIMFIDIDRFKTINDSLGHDIGDKVLVEIASRLQASIRETDVVARFGGDEFVVLLNEILSEDDAAAVADKLLKAIENRIEVDGHAFFLSASIGVSIYPNDGATIQTLFRHADISLYQAKENGRNGFKLYSSIKDSYDSQKIKLEHGLKEGIKKNQLELYYQPIVNVRTRKAVAMEALVRWNHPELGFLMPKEFIGVAEETGLIVPLGKWTLKAACKQLLEWKKEGLDIKIATNLSTRQFMEPDLVDFISALIKDDPYLASHLEIEITESIAMKNSAEVMHKLKELSHLGLNLIIDDFGTGYSSLSYLRKFPIKKLKIDQSFVRECLLDSSDSAIIRAIISMAHNLHLYVVGEGVEAVEQMDFLDSVGCDEAQGYYISLPLKKNQATDWLKRYKDSSHVDLFSSGREEAAI